jgi:L-asparagine transporter-like permease
MAEPDQSFNQVALSELSRHYDTMLWTVTSLWAGSVGGLFLYVRDKNNFDPWIAAFGLVLTVGGMYFAYSFRASRRRVHERMTREVQDLHISKLPFSQWGAFLCLFIGLLALWTLLLVEKSLLWFLLLLPAAIAILWLWLSEREENCRPNST